MMMTRSIITPFWINNKLHLLLPDNVFGDLNEFSDLEHDDVKNGYILPAEDFELYQNEIERVSIAYIHRNDKDYNPQNVEYGES